FSLFMPDISFGLFGISFCIINLMIIWNYDRIIPIIGAFLTPWLLMCITAVVIGGFVHSVATPAVAEPMSNLQAFNFGLLKGYHTMDLMAAFFFSATSVGYLRQHLKHQKAQTQLI